MQIVSTGNVEVCQLTPSAARILVWNRFSVLESTVGDTECLMSTVVDGSSGNVEGWFRTHHSEKERL